MSLLLAFLACHPEPVDSEPVPVDTAFGDDTYPYERLSTYGFFDGPLTDQTPAEGVIPYEVAVALWSDGAEKERFIVPSGPILAEGLDDWTFTEGTVLVKTFSFEGVRIETRLLVLVDGAWQSLIYLWDADQSEATRLIAGERVDVERLDADGAAYTQEYLVPNENQCETCHRRDDVVHPLGPMTRQMNVTVVRDGASVNQIDWLRGLGAFGTDPGEGSTLDAFVDAFDPTLDLEARTRGYLHANCSHCHREGGYSGNSGLYLQAEEDSLEQLGVCKVSAAAGAGTGGFTYDIVPGDPDTSIMPFRMASADPEIKMPELPNLVPDAEGLALVREWIAGMEGSCEP